MTYLLHIDTSADLGIVAIGGDGVLLAQQINEESRNHAATINTMTAEVLAAAGIVMAQLDGIVVCSGPGSYTGLRIGMATAKGLCYALDIPLLTHDRLTLLAYGAYNRNTDYDALISLLNAREKEYFIAIYNKEFKNIVSPVHVFEDQLAAMLDSNKKYYILTDVQTSIFYDLKVNNPEIDNKIKIDVSAWAFYAYEKYKINDIANLSAAEPLYLKQVYTHK